MASARQLALRIRDKKCTYVDGCDELIQRQSELCRHHLGVVHGEASARTYTCSEDCQEIHRRCTAPHCGRLTGGEHKVILRDGLCFSPGQITCWPQKFGRRAKAWWHLTCITCSHTWQREHEPPLGTRCPNPKPEDRGGCRSMLLEAEQIVGWETPPDLLARWPTVATKAPQKWW